MPSHLFYFLLMLGWPMVALAVAVRRFYETMSRISSWLDLLPFRVIKQLKYLTDPFQIMALPAGGVVVERGW